MSIEIQLQSADNAWHYTTGEKLLLIQRSGKLKTTAIGTSYPERPVLWFSTHPEFEPTAQKLLHGLGPVRRATVIELRKYAKGLFRFGISRSKLVPWRELVINARMSRTVARKLEERGRECGAYPGQWFGSFNDIACDQLILEKMDDQMNWLECRSPS